MLARSQKRNQRQELDIIGSELQVVVEIQIVQIQVFTEVQEAQLAPGIQDRQ